MQFVVWCVLLSFTVFGCSSSDDAAPQELAETSDSRTTNTSDTSDTTLDEVSLAPVCGDGVCQEGEECAADCTSDCWTNSCGFQQAACLATQECLELKTCIWGCSTEACITRCQSRFAVEANAAYTQFFMCGVEADVMSLSVGMLDVNPAKTAMKIVRRSTLVTGDAISHLTMESPVSVT